MSTVALATARTATARTATARIAAACTAGAPTSTAPAVRTRGERGSATVTACLALLTLLAVTAMVAQLGAAVTARHRVQSAADLASLAAAAALIEGPVAGCAAATALAARTGTHLRECTVDQWDVTVVAELRIPLGLFGARFASAAARAGPVDKIE